MSMVPTPAQIRAQVAAILGKAPNARVIGIRAPLSVETSESLRVGDVELPVARCDSVLEIRDRLETTAAGDTRMVLLTPLAEGELGADVIARLAKRHLFSIEPWQLVKDRFRARYVDPRLVQHHPWVARALLDSEPEGGYPPAPSGFIQAEVVWQVLFESLLGITGGPRDAETLLEWSLNGAERQRSDDLDQTLRRSLANAVDDSAGAVARRVFECATGPHGDNTVAVGLATRALFGPAAAGDATATKATGKLEAWLGGGELNAEVALAWADAAEAVVLRRLARGSMKEVQPILKQADVLLTELGATESAYRSRFLAAGYEQRLAKFAEALGKFVKGKAKTLPPTLAEAAESVLDHVLVAYPPERAARVEMGVRLARWLGGQRANGEAGANSFAEAARAYRESGGHLDWSRARIWDGDPLAPLNNAYTALWQAARRIREAENRRFGELLANWTATGSHDHSLLTVEDVIGRVLAPLAKVQPVLLVVIDGMGMAVYRELQTDLLRRGWVEVDADGESLRLPVIAALPTVTEASRTSLLSGKLVSGNSSNEKLAFSQHPALIAARASSKPPVLYHKGDLTGGDAVGLAPAVLKEIGDLRRPVIGVVINAVDDHLAKGEQVRVDWTAHRIRPLEELLMAARDAGRAVIVVSDHGHIPEHNTVPRGEEGAERWREASTAPLDDEVHLKGPRVVLGEGKGIIAPWSEQVRFGTKKNGYHGGATPQEVVIPLGVFLPSGVTVEGWTEVSAEVPEWWETEMEVARAVVRRPPATVKPKPPAEPGEQGRLFASEAEVAAARQETEAEWISRLLASEVMQAQRRLTSRVALPEDRIRGILTALDDRGGKLTRPALAKQLGVPPMRLGGMLSALRRLLNVEGYPVLSVHEDSDTIELNRSQLFTQFRL